MKLNFKKTLLVKSFLNYKGGNIIKKNSRNLLVLLFVIILIISIYAIYKFIKSFIISYYSKNNCDNFRGCLLLPNVKHGNKEHTIHHSSNNINSDGSGYSICIWLYIKSDNFNSKIQKYKSILYRSTSKKHDSFNDEQYLVQPGIWLMTNTNKLLIRWNTAGQKNKYSNSSEEEDLSNNISLNSMNPYINAPNKLCSGIKMNNKTVYNYSDNNKDNEVCVDNIPLDRWFHLSLVLHNQSADIYMDGKLYSTITLNSSPVEVGHMEWVLSKDSSPSYKNKNGFEGAMTQFRYFNTSLSHYDILRVYSWGPYPFIPDIF